MAIIKFDKENFIASMRPMIVSLVIKEFEDELEQRLNTIIEDTFKTMNKELPKKIETEIGYMMDLSKAFGENVKIEIDLKDCYNKEVKDDVLQG